MRRSSAWGAWAPAILILLASTIAAAQSVSPDGAASAAQPNPPAPKSTLILPPPPLLTPIAMPVPPASFCSEEARVKYLTEVYNPAAETATANATAAANHLSDLGQATSASTATYDIIAGRGAFAGYKPTADQAYGFGVDIQKVRPVIMAAPIVPCAAAGQTAAQPAPAVVAYQPPPAPPPPAPAPVAYQPPAPQPAPAYAPQPTYAPPAPAAPAYTTAAASPPRAAYPPPPADGSDDLVAGAARAETGLEAPAPAQGASAAAPPAPYAPPPSAPTYAAAPPPTYAPANMATTGRVLPGPKKTIAVGALQASGGFTSDDNWRAGPALSAMLTKLLSDSGRLVVVDRSALSDVLNEQQLRATKVAGGGGDAAGPPVKMIPAQYLVEGAVTEFGSPNKGGGLSFGAANSSGLGGGLGLTRDTGKISIDFRILSPRTSEVLNTFTVTHEVSHVGLSINTDYNGMAFGGDAFNRTPLGEASRQALAEAAQRIADFVSQGVWEGRVVDFDNVAMDIYVNAGAEAGVVPGDRLQVQHIGRTLTDPDTGQILSERREILGELVVTDTEPKVAHGRFIPVQPGLAPQRGDLVVFVGAQ